MGGRRWELLTKILVIITSADKTPTSVVPFIIDYEAMPLAQGFTLLTPTCISASRLCC